MNTEIDNILAEWNTFKASPNFKPIPLYYYFTGKNDKIGISIFGNGKVVHKAKTVEEAEIFISGWYGKETKLKQIKNVNKWKK